ncbi:MAG TPA: type VI secretion system lipoprotein TssJ [Marinagarivorans sp.]
MTPTQHIPRLTFRLFAVFFMGLALAACQTSRKALDLETIVTLDLYTGKDVNPDADSRPSPVVVRVFKLTDDRRFKRADFLSLYESADNRLGDNLLGVVTLKELAPGEVRQEVIKLTDEARFIGIMAEFSNYTNAKPLLALEVVPHSNNKYEVSLSKASVSRVER